MCFAPTHAPIERKEFRCGGYQILQRQAPLSRTLHPRKRASVVIHQANVAACSSTIGRPVSCRFSAIYWANLHFANR